MFLHYQEKIVAQCQKRWIEEVYTPNPQDKMVIAFRQWLEKRAGGGIPWANDPTLPTAERDKQRLFDVWHTHPKNCQVCQRALSRITWAKRGAYGSAIVLFAWALMINAMVTALVAVNEMVSVSRWTMPPLSFWAALSVAGLLASAGYGLQRLDRLFYIYEFEHADND